MRAEEERFREFADEFTRRLSEMRIAKKMTPGRLAALIGSSPAQISRWESGEQLPKLH